MPRSEGNLLVTTDPYGHGAEDCLHQLVSCLNLPGALGSDDVSMKDLLLTLSLLNKTVRHSVISSIHCLHPRSICVQYLKGFNTLRTLDFCPPRSACKLEAVNIGQVLRLTHLTALRLSNWQSRADLRALQLFPVAQLTALDLSFNWVHGLEALMPQLSNLQHLQLTYVSGLKHQFLLYLAHTPQLSLLDMRHAKRIGSCQGNSLAALLALKHLAVLNLAHTGISLTAQHVQQLLAVLGPQLQHLDVSHAQWHSTGTPQLHLPGPCSRLQSLSISKCTLQSMIGLGAQFPSLTMLDISTYPGPQPPRFAEIIALVSPLTQLVLLALPHYQGEGDTFGQVFRRRGQMQALPEAFPLLQALVMRGGKHVGVHYLHPSSREALIALVPGLSEDLSAVSCWLYKFMILLGVQHHFTTMYLPVLAPPLLGTLGRGFSQHCGTFHSWGCHWLKGAPDPVLCISYKDRRGPSLTLTARGFRCGALNALLTPIDLMKHHHPGCVHDAESGRVSSSEMEEYVKVVGPVVGQTSVMDWSDDLRF